VVDFKKGRGDLKWGLVEKAEDYKFSSAKEYKIKHGEALYA
jgi:hypothetical protein